MEEVGKREQRGWRGTGMSTMEGSRGDGEE